MSWEGASPMRSLPWQLSWLLAASNVHQACLLGKDVLRQQGGEGRAEKREVRVVYAMCRQSLARWPCASAGRRSELRDKSIIAYIVNTVDLCYTHQPACSSKTERVAGRREEI